MADPVNPNAGLVYHLASSWADAEQGTVNHFHAASAAHHPQVTFKIVAAPGGLSVWFDVKNDYVLARKTQRNDAVCRDSCVELFIQPEGACGYINIEANAIGTLLVSHIRDWRRLADGTFTDYTLLSADELIATPIFHEPILDDQNTPINWRLQIDVPYAFLKGVFGADASMREFRGNLYKCGDETRYPHWASWAPIGKALNFHVPEYFGRLVCIG